MAATELMTWSKTDKRWHKGYMGSRYAVSPRQLKTAPTKEASRQAANDWWVQKQKEIDEALGMAKQHPANVVSHYRSAEGNHRMYAKWQRKYGDVELAEKSEAMIEWLHESLKTDNPPYPLETWQKDPLHEMWMDEQGFGMWIERMNQVIRDEKAETAVPKEDTIRAHVDDYLATRKAQAEATGKVGTYETLSQKLHLFRSWLDPLARIDALNEVLWERFCLYLAKQVKDGRLAPSTAQGIQISTRAFIRNRWERRFIELPRNLTARNLSANVPLQEIEVFTKEEIGQLIGTARSASGCTFCLC